MKYLPKTLIYLALASIICGLLFKILNIDLAKMYISTVYPILPNSFLRFSNSILLLSIALSVLNLKKEE